MPLTLATPSLELEWDERTGALIRLELIDAAWSVVARPMLGMSFALLVPAPGRGSRMVQGAAQTAPQVSSDVDHVTFSWASVVGDDGEPLDIAVTQSWRVDGAAIVVDTEIDNRSEYTVENVFSPSIGGLRPKHPDHSLEAIRHAAGAAVRCVVKHPPPLCAKFESCPCIRPGSCSPCLASHRAATVPRRPRTHFGAKHEFHLAGGHPAEQRRGRTPGRRHRVRG